MLLAVRQDDTSNFFACTGGICTPSTYTYLKSEVKVVLEYSSILEIYSNFLVVMALTTTDTATAHSHSHKLSAKRM
jgi:hypothetical protein